MKLTQLFILISLSLILIIGCQEEFDSRTLPTATNLILGDTSYVEIFPAFEGFKNPTAILAGHDQLLYIADTDNNRIIQMNEAGVILGEITILRPIALAQDLRLDLLVSGEIIRETTGDTIGGLFRIHLYEAEHVIANARIDTVFKGTAKPKRRYRGIGILRENQYLIARDGPDNTSFIDPDTRVLWINKNDTLITPIGDLATREGSGIVDILRVTGLVTFPNSNDFILIQSSVDGRMTYGALWMVYHKSYDFEGWLPKFTTPSEFMRPKRFIEPSAVTIDRSRLDIFIIDQANDSIHKFDRRGLYKAESFGNGKIAASGQGKLMKAPKGAAFMTKTLYVSDSGNNIIRRFRLSTDR
ncbi:MAG: hypothetical protein Q8K98_00820 [Bacteroidota bacterium]|nr:hypothetical protein [Bacteroidota bacterium]